MSSNPSIEIHHLPTSSDSPSWESPRTFESKTEGGAIVSGPIQPTTPIGQGLKALSLELETLMRTQPSVPTLKVFLDRWKVEDSTTSGIHPLVLEWLNHSKALEPAIEGNRIDLLKTLFNYGFRVNANDMNALMVDLARTDDKTMLELVLEGGWDINTPIDLKGPVLSRVIRNEDLVKWCLARGADPNGASTNGSYTVLHAAAQYSSVSTISLLLEAGGDISPTSASAAVVAYAANLHSSSSNRIPVITYLLDQGADIDLIMGSKWPEDAMGTSALLAWGKKNALHWAIENGTKDLVEFLLQRGADMNIKAWSLTTKMKLVDVEELADICRKRSIKKVLVSWRNSGV